MNELTIKNFDTLELNELEAINGGKGIGRTIEAVAGSVGLANAIEIGVIGGPWVGVGIAAASSWIGVGAVAGGLSAVGSLGVMIRGF